MKILHLPESFLPYSMGGKEIYCFNMAKRFSEMGHENHILIHLPKNKEIQSIEINNLKTHQLSPINPSPSINNWYSLRLNEEDYIPEFENKLKEINPDWIIFHDQNGGASLSHLRTIKKVTKAKISLVFHSPGQMCVNKLLLERNESFCTKPLEVRNCTYCKITSLNKLNPVLAKGISYLPKTLLNKKMPTGLVYEYISSTKEFYNLVDEIFYHANWVKDLLLRNKIDERKLTFWSLEDILQKKTKPVNTIKSEVYKIILIGRPTWIKGAHLLVDAVEKIPKNIPLEIHFLGKEWGEDSYSTSLMNRMKMDNRFKTPTVIPNDQMPKFLSEMNLCIAPSIWPETGPISVLDALESGLDVLGANLAGIADQSKKYGFETFKWNNSLDLSIKIHKKAISFFKN